MRSARRNTIRLAVVGLCVALCAAVGGCGKPAPAPVGGSTSSKAAKARTDAEELALRGVTGGAAAQAGAEPEQKVRHQSKFNVEIGKAAPGGLVTGGTHPVALPGVPSPADTKSPAPAPPALVAKGPPGPKSTPRSGWVIRERVVSPLSPTEAEAEEEALALACEVVKQKLAALDPPVPHKPSLGEVKGEFLRKDSRVVRPPDAAEKERLKPYLSAEHLANLVYVEYDVEVTAEQVRELRAQERVSIGLRVVGMLLAVALAGFLFLRADEWTKGYLTRWLALGAVTLAGGAAAALFFV
jgi:hypothetical protein